MGNKPGTGQKINHIKFAANDILIGQVYNIVIVACGPRLSILMSYSVEKSEGFSLSYSPNFGTV